MQHGSLINTITGSSTEPEVGMGATFLMWSDRHAMTIVEVIRFKSGARAGQVRTVRAQQDIARRTDSNGMSDSQTYEFTRDFSGTVRTFTVNKRGEFVGAGGRLAVGFRDEHFDFTF